MRLDEISIDGFGRLSNSNFTFGPGINLILGPNEAGKSTLLQAIFALLYGFFDAGSVTASRRELHNMFRPWDTATPYAASLTFITYENRKYRVERSFDGRMKTSLFAMPQQNEITHRYRSDSNGRLYFADELLGMSRTVFENTCCLRQSELVKLESSATAITEAITQRTTTATGNLSASSALSALQAILRDEIGTQRAWTKPLAAANKEVQQLDEHINRETELQSRLWSVSYESSQYYARLVQLRLQSERFAYLKLLAEQSDRKRAMTEIEQARQNVNLRRRCVAELDQYALVQTGQRDEILRLIGERGQLDARLAEGRSRTTDWKSQLSRLEESIAQTEELMDSGTPALILSPRERERILSLHQEWRLVVDKKKVIDSSVTTLKEETDQLAIQLDTERVANQKAISLGTVQLARLQANLDAAQRELDTVERNYEAAKGAWQTTGMDKDAFHDLSTRANDIIAGKAPVAQKKGCNPFAASKRATVTESSEVSIFQDIAPLYNALEETRRATDKAHAAVMQMEMNVCSELGLDSSQQITDKVFDEQQSSIVKYGRLETQFQLRKRMLSESQSRANQLAESLAKLRAELLSALATHGIQTDNPESGLKTYLALYDNQVQSANVFAKLDGLRQQRNTVVAQLTQLDSWNETLANLETRIATMLAQACPGLASIAPISLALQEYDRLCELHEQWQAAKQELNSAEQQLAILQRIDKEHGTIHLFEVGDRRILQLLQAHPEWVGLVPKGTIQDIDGQLEELSTRIRDVQDEIARLQHEMSTSEIGYTPLAGIIEDRSIAIKNYQQLLGSQAQFTKAIDLLAAATTEFQQAFAPRLEARVAQSLAQITDKRYEKAKVDPANLGLHVWSQEVDKWTPAETLSTGTRDLIYLTMRIAISDLLSDGKEPLPILLDDPFVHLDASRERNALAFLENVANDYQVLFFSKDLTLADRFAHTYDERVLVHL